MRITYNFMTMKYLNGVNSSLNALVRANEQVYKGRNLLNPEDDPVNYLTAFNIQRSVDNATQYNRNANNALIWLTNEDNELQTASSILSRAKDELAIQGINDSQDADSRKAIAGEVLNIYQEMMDIANSQYLDRYIFGGFETETEPFTTGERQVTSVMSNLNGGEAFTSRLYGDLPDLKQGQYTVTATSSNGVIYVSMRDSMNKSVILDSNGSDETTENGNLTSAQLVTAFVPGQVISTGRGVGIKLPDDMTDGQSLTLSFYYTPGDDVQYVGDDGVINSKIGENQSVALNISGEDIFMETYKTVLGTMSNTINGVAISETTFFSNIDGSNVSTADSVSFSGTDHNGYKIGTARVTSPKNVDLDMSKATAEQRTITLTYGGKSYDLTMDQDGYADMDEVVFNLNRMLDNQGIGGEIAAINDGDKIMFMTTRAGSGVSLRVQGSEYNTLGFNTLPITSTGKDTVFELSYSNYEGPIETVHDDLPIVSSASGTLHTYFVNGQQIDFTVYDTDSMQDIEDKINAALKDEGMGFDVHADLAAGTNSGYKLTFELVNQNYTKDTFLATRVDTGGADAYEYSTAKGGDYPLADEKRISDMLDFIEELYDNAVTASIVDGKVQVKDIRSGTSRLSFNISEDNTGIGYPMLEPSVALSGRYSGSGDDKWSVSVSVVSANITLLVTDSKGNELVNNSSNPISANSYNGDEIYLAQGVSIKIGELTASTSFTVDLVAFSNLSFGDLNVVEDGKNVNVFTSLKNLYDALDKNIPDSGIAAPSAWRDTSLNSTATPYFDGEFRGNYNDELKFQVEYYGSESEFYIQHELSWASQEVTSYQDLNIDFDIMLKTDKTNPTLSTFNFTVDPSLSASGTMIISSLVDQINSNASLKSLGVQAYSDNGKLRIDSGSGNTEITVNYNNSDTALAFGLVDNPTSGKQLPTHNLTADSELTVHYHVGGTWYEQAVVIPEGNYADMDALITEINNQLDAALGVPGLIYAELNELGTIEFKDNGLVDDIVISGDGKGELGFYPITEANTVKVPQRPTLDVSEKNIEERTLTFDYTTTNGVDSMSIIVDKENFQSLDELIDNINQKLTLAGYGSEIECVKIGEDKYGFNFTSGGANDIVNMHVSGDYEGTLGIEKGGDVAKIKITSSNGDLVNMYLLDTANEKNYVADGVYHHYDAGYVYATDSFTVAIGSGIEYELPVLAKAESQIHKALTIVGNRQNKTESAMAFNEALITMNDELKAEYTGSTTLAQAKASTDFTVAQTVYQAALSSTAKILQISLMNYL